MAENNDNMTTATIEISIGDLTELESSLEQLQAMTRGVPHHDNDRSNMRNLSISLRRLGRVQDADTTYASAAPRLVRFFNHARLLPLVELKIRLPHRLPPRVLEATLRQTKHTLRSLVLDSWNPVAGDYGISNTLQEHPTLERFDTYVTPPPDRTQLARLVRALTTCPKLRDVHLAMRPPCDDPLPVFEDSLQGLCGNAPSLKKLWFVWGGHSNLSHDFEAICAQLQTNTALEELYLCTSENFREGPVGTFCQAVVDLIATNQTLQTLALQFTGSRMPFTTTAPDSPSSGQIVPSNDNPGMFLFATALRANRSIRQFRLLTGGQFLGAQVIDAYVEMLKDNYVLEELKLGFDDEELGPDIAFYLRLNQLGRSRLLRAGNGASRSEWLETIIDHHDDHRVVHYLLSLNPSLLADEPTAIATTNTSSSSGSGDEERPTKRQRS